MKPTLYRSGGIVSESDVRSLAEFCHSEKPDETPLHHVIEAHPNIIGALGFLEFLSEFPLCARDSRNQLILDPRCNDRADIIAARLDIAPDLRAKKFANLIELKGSRYRVLGSTGHGNSVKLSEAIGQLEDYSRSLLEQDNRMALASFGWEVWQPGKVVIMGSISEFREPGQLEAFKQRLLATGGVRLILTEEFLALVETQRKVQHELVSEVPETQGVVGLYQSNKFAAPLIIASNGLAGLVLAQKRLKHVLTPYGNVDLRTGVPSDLSHLREKRLQPLARKLGIPYAEAIVAFSAVRRRYLSVKQGIVVADFDVQALLSAHEEREYRNRPLREKMKAKRLAQAAAEARARRELLEQAKEKAAVYEQARRGKLKRLPVAQRPRVEAEALAQQGILLLSFADGIKQMFPALPESRANQIAAHATKPGSRRVGTVRTLSREKAIWLAVAAYAAYRHFGFVSKAEADLHRERVLQLLRSWGGPDPATIL